MKTGTVDAQKVIGILNRYRQAPSSMRRRIVGEIVAELLAVADADDPQGNALVRGAVDRFEVVNDLRSALEWEEVQGNSTFMAAICRKLRQLRETP